MPKQKTPFAEVGDVWEGLDSYSARVQFRDTAGLLKHIYGPHRAGSATAEADLAAVTRSSGLAVKKVMYCLS